MTSLDTKLSFTLKDMIYIMVITVSIIGNYYSTDLRLFLVEKSVSAIEKQVDENSKLTKAIYIGLVAKGIIKPGSIE